MAQDDGFNDTRDTDAGATRTRRRRVTPDAAADDATLTGAASATGDDAAPVVEGTAPWDHGDALGDTPIGAADIGLDTQIGLDTPITVGATDLDLGYGTGDASIASGSALLDDDLTTTWATEEVPGSAYDAATGGIEMGTTGSELAGDVYGAYPAYAEDVTGGSAGVTAGSEVVAVGQPYDTTTTPRVVQVLRENPVPAGLIGIGLGWMLVKYLERFDTAAARTALQDAQARAREVAATAQETATQAVQGAQERAQDLADRVTTGVQDLTSRGDTGATNGAGGTHDLSGTALTGTQDASPGITERAQDAIGTATEAAQDAVTSATTAAQDTVERVTASAQDTADRVAVTAQQAADRVTTTAQQTAERVATTAQQTADTIVITTRDAGIWTVDVIQTAARRAQEEVGRTLRERPLAVEAMAVAAGAALALALPQLRQENQVLGETRDRVIAKASSAAEQVLERIPVGGDNGSTGRNNGQ